MDSHVRRANPSDAQIVRDLTRTAYAKWIPVIGREPKPMTVDYHRAVADHLIDLLYIDGVLAGLIEMIPEPDHLTFENVAVSPAHQGSGHGRRLLRHAEAQAVSMGYGEVRLLTNKMFEANVRLYLALGYRIDREQSTPNLGVAVHMSKPVAAA